MLARVWPPSWDHEGNKMIAEEGTRALKMDKHLGSGWCCLVVELSILIWVGWRNNKCFIAKLLLVVFHITCNRKPPKWDCRFPSGYRTAPGYSLLVGLLYLTISTNSSSTYAGSLDLMLENPVSHRHFVQKKKFYSSVSHNICRTSE